MGMWIYVALTWSKKAFDMKKIKKKKDIPNDSSFPFLFWIVTFFFFSFFAFSTDFGQGHVNKVEIHDTSLIISKSLLHVSILMSNKGIFFQSPKFYWGSILIQIYLFIYLLIFIYLFILDFESWSHYVA